MSIYHKPPTPTIDSTTTNSNPISLIVFCVDKSHHMAQYRYIKSLEDSIDVVSRSLRCQVDIHQLFNIPNLVILTNFDFSYKGVTAINMPNALCKKNSYGNKYTLPYQYFKETNIKQDVWLHDYDCFPQMNFQYPSLTTNQIGGVLTKPNYINSGSLFIGKDDLDFFETFKKIYDITNYHPFDEYLLNDLFFNKRLIIDKNNNKNVSELFKGFKKEHCSLNVEYNYSFAMAQKVRKLDFTPLAIHFHPEKPEQHRCFEGKNIIKEELNKIFLEHCPIDYRNRNLELYTKWRFPKNDTKKPPIQVSESVEQMDGGFLKNTELTDFFKQNLHKITSVDYLEDVIKFKVGFDLSRKVVKFSPDLKTGGLCANQIPNEIASFLFHILNSRYKIDSYMEVGVNLGGTFYLIDSFLRAINPNYVGAVAVDRKNVLLDRDNYFKKYQTTKILIGDSKRMVISEKFDLIFIDGDHTYPGVKADYLNFKSCSDFIAFHDVDILHRSTNVKKLWEEIKKEYPNNTMEFFNKSPEFQTTLGIGVLMKTNPKLMS